VFEVDDTGMDDGDGLVQLISVSITLSPDTDDMELLRTPWTSWFPLGFDVGGINDNGWCWEYEDEDLALRLNAASSEKWGNVLPLLSVFVTDVKFSEIDVSFWQPFIFKFSTYIMMYH
jgi:hypothetical protein